MLHAFLYLEHDEQNTEVVKAMRERDLDVRLKGHASIYCLQTELRYDG